MSTTTNQMILGEIRAIKSLLNGLEKSQASKADDLLFRALVMLSKITETLSEPDFAPEQIMLYCEHLRAFLMDARLVLEGREPIHV